MKIFLVLTVFVFAATARTTRLFEDEWQLFKSTHSKFYRSLLDETSRYFIFEENLKKIEEHNALYEQGLKSYKLGVTKFADLSDEEFKELLGLSKRDKSTREAREVFQIPEGAEIPESIDWREKGAVTKVKDQGACGACWAFSATGSLEGQYFIKYNKLVSFSEQQLVDCSRLYDNEGCEGGNLDPAFSYIRDYGIETEESYPFDMFNENCRYNTSLVVTKIEGYVDVEPNNEDALVAAVGLVGPVSVGIDASGFQLYKEGLYEGNDCSQTELNHGVLAVGYGSYNGQDYWIIKNSWGKSFGDNGYVFMKRGVNQCGIALEPSYPVL